MAFALALEEEEKRVFEARRSAAAAAAKQSTEEGTFGSKIRFATSTASSSSLFPGVGSGGGSTTAQPPRRWGVADVEALEEGRESELFQGDGREGADDGGGDEESGEGGGGGGEGEAFRAVPGGGRRKGKMPLFKNSAGEVVSKHDAVICGK